jgi:hypothetical protein
MPDAEYVSGPSAEALASVPAENARRARLYDLLWDFAYRGKAVSLRTWGTHDTVFSISVGGEGYTGSMEQVEAWLTAHIDGSGGIDR